MNNAPNDITPKDLIIPENCSILSESRPGSYAARNKALSIAKGNIIAFTDSDCIPDKDWLKNGVDALKSNNVSRIGGAVEVFAGESPNIAEVYDLIFAFPQQVLACPSMAQDGWRGSPAAARRLRGRGKICRFL